MMTIARFVAVAVLGFFVGLMPATSQTAWLRQPKN
jgi:hypothetical protein